MLGNATLQIPVTRETANILSDLWVNYQLLGIAAARGDSLNDPKLIDEAALGITSHPPAALQGGRRQELQGGLGVRDQLQSGDGRTVRRAAHPLQVPRQRHAAAKGFRQEEGASVRPQVTAANFAAMAKRTARTPARRSVAAASAAFHRGDMVKRSATPSRR